MSETLGYAAFAAAVRALPPNTMVYFRDFADPFVAMTPTQLLTDPEFVHYQGTKHAFLADIPTEGSQFFAELAALGLRHPIIWHVTRGEPAATVIWERL